MPRILAPHVLGLTVLLAATGTACEATYSDEPGTTTTQTVDLDHAEAVTVSLKMGAGELTVRGGASKLMEGTFTFSPKEKEPVVDYKTTESRGRLQIEEPSGRSFSHSKEEWNLRLNDTKPTDIEVNFGAGKGQLEVGSLNLRSVSVEMGVGELQLDLRGTPSHDYTVTVHGGVGEAAIHLPKGVGIYADVKGGIGEIEAGGLEKRDGHYVNSAYGVAPTTVRLDVRGGVGSIKLITD